jgi:phage I-like protein
LKKPFASQPAYLSQPIDLVALADGEGKLPTEFCLFGNGKTRTTKGDFLCDAVHASAAVAQLAADGRDQLPIDYDHDMVSPLGTNKKAAGWFKLAARDGALWATEVAWTPAAAKALSEREYRYFSPAFLRDEKGFVSRVINVAICNLPATLNQAALVASEHDTNMDPEILAAELAKVKADNVALLAATTQLQADLKTATDALKLAADERAAAEKAAFVTELSTTGKLAPALKTWALNQSLDALKAFAKDAPVVALADAEKTTTAKPATADSGATILSEDEKKCCVLLGVSEADYLSTKKHLEASGNVWAYDPNAAQAAVKESK